MVKLIIQIPCYNEEQALPATLADLPRELPGVDVIEWLIIDDGSSDRTVEVARANKVDHVVVLPHHQGLAAGFMAGLEASVKAGADIVVNTDADNQYRAVDIPKLIEPILAGQAEIVVGARPIDDIVHFSVWKKLLQRLGSRLVRFVSRTDVVDAPSGFRAFSRDAAMRLQLFGEYTYTLETIIQAGQKNMAIMSVPIGVNRDMRPSRLVRSIRSYLLRSAITILRIFIVYRPLRFFAALGGILFLAGFLIGARFLIFYLWGEGVGHIQSLILAALLMGIGFQVLVAGILADLIAVNRKLLERIDWRVRKIEETAERANINAERPPPRPVRAARDGGGC